MSGLQERRQRIGGTTWWIRESAPPHPSPGTVIMIPGLGEGDYMCPHAELLARHWRLLLVDMPGFGRTRAARRLRTVEEFGDHLAELIVGVDAAPAMLVGSSFGCQIATATAARRPELVDRLVLVSPTFDAAARSVRRQILRWLPTMVREPPGLAIGLARSYWRAGVRTPLFAFLAGLRDPIEDRAPKVAVPALVVRGAQDHIVSAEWAQELADRFPAGELTTIPDAAHTLDYAAPDALAAKTVAFLRTTDRPTAT